MQNKAQQEFTREAMLHAAFFMEGLNEAGYDACILAWDQGCIEMVDELVQYAPFLERLAAAVDDADIQRCGVLDYEVSGSFGKWFGRYILAHPGEAPPKSEAEDWLAKEVVTFFVQHDTDVANKLMIEQIVHSARGSSAAQPEWLWVRMGDNSDYEQLDDISELDFEGCLTPDSEVSGWTKYGFTVHPFEGANYISCFWGDRNAQPTRALDEAEKCRVELKVLSADHPTLKI